MVHRRDMFGRVITMSRSRATKSNQVSLVGHWSLNTLMAVTRSLLRKDGTHAIPDMVVRRNMPTPGTQGTHTLARRSRLCPQAGNGNL